MSQDEFENMLARKAGQHYENYGAIGQQLLGEQKGATVNEKELER